MKLFISNGNNCSVWGATVILASPGVYGITATSIGEAITSISFETALVSVLPTVSAQSAAIDAPLYHTQKMLPQKYTSLKGRLWPRPLFVSTYGHAAYLGSQIGTLVFLD